jgi:hypothetical protein
MKWLRELKWRLAFNLNPFAQQRLIKELLHYKGAPMILYLDHGELWASYVVYPVGKSIDVCKRMSQ